MDVTSNTPLQSETSQAPQPVTLAQAFWYWLKLGFISFGGPAGQIAIMHQDLVEKKRWISERRFLHALNYCMVLPGPEAQQLATYIGWLMHRTWGGIIAGGLFVLPSFFILVGLAWIYMAYGSVPAVAGVLYGIKPAVVAIVLFAAYRIGSRTLKNNVLWAIAALAFLAIVRGADTSRLDLTPQSAGLYAISVGLSRTFEDDHEMLAHGMVMYDALYAWCKDCQEETHNWPPQMK